MKNPFKGPPIVWQRRLKLGTYFRIGVYVHWSFAILVAYVAFAGYQDGAIGALFGVSLLIGMFFCVTLHEYGHALAARRFGIETMDITLFPIGGVARLMKIPRVPWQELVVAVAGPAVNVVIVIALGILIAVMPNSGLPSLGKTLTDPSSTEQVFAVLDSPTVTGFVLSMMLVNTALIIFNMIPAFPMDGGRVLRSLLAMALEYRRATRIASYIGVFCAVLMGLLALYNNAVTAGLIAVFICYAGLSEARQVEALEPLRGLFVRDAMLYSPPSVRGQMPVPMLLESIRSCPTTVLPVLDQDDRVIGMLSIRDLIQSAQMGIPVGATVADIANREVPCLFPDESLEAIVTGIDRTARQFPVTDSDGKLVGMLDLDTLRLRAQLVA